MPGGKKKHSFVANDYRMFGVLYTSQFVSLHFLLSVVGGLLSVIPTLPDTIRND